MQYRDLSELERLLNLHHITKWVFKKRLFTKMELSSVVVKTYNKTLMFEARWDLKHI